MEKIDPVEAAVLIYQSYRVPHVSIDCAGHRFWLVYGGKSPAPVVADGTKRKRRGRRPKIALSLPTPRPEPEEEVEPTERE